MDEKSFIYVCEITICYKVQSALSERNLARGQWVSSSSFFTFCYSCGCNKSVLGYSAAEELFEPLATLFSAVHCGI